MNKEMIVAAARQCLGTPFRHQGRRVGHGLDCIGVLVHVARELGLGHTDACGYGRLPSRALLENGLDSQACLERIDRAAWGDADVLLMRFDADPQHVGIWTGQTIIHAYAEVGRCVEHTMDATWRARIVRAYLLKGGD